MSGWWTSNKGGCGALLLVACYLPVLQNGGHATCCTECGTSMLIQQTDWAFRRRVDSRFAHFTTVCVVVVCIMFCRRLLVQANQRGTPVSDQTAQFSVCKQCYLDQNSCCWRRCNTAFIQASIPWLILTGLLTGLTNPVESRLALRLSGSAILEKAHLLVTYPCQMTFKTVDRWSTHCFLW